MHIGPIFRFHFIDCYHSELPEVTTSYNQKKTQECSGYLCLNSHRYSSFSSHHAIIQDTFLYKYDISIFQSFLFGPTRYPEITLGFRYRSSLFNIRTLSVNIKFICTSFRNRQNSEPLASFSGLFRSEYKWILYLTTIYVYCVYPAMSKKSENLSDLNKKDRNKRHWQCKIYVRYFILILKIVQNICLVLYVHDILTVNKRYLSMALVQSVWFSVYITN
jgi:hypothetical protein